MTGPADGAIFQGYRHLYTAWPVGARGTAGFQTIACSQPLRDHLRILERWVEDYRPEEGRGAHHSFLWVPLQQVKNLSLLTWLAPLGQTPEGRPGNYWAESLVVPSAWLRHAGWDPLAIFEAVSSQWLGPKACDAVQKWPHDLDPVPLAPVLPGPLERLSLIAETLPESSLYTFVQTVVRQYRSRAPIAFVAPPEMAPETLERLLLLAPLVLPPSRRRASFSGGSRMLRLRTLGRFEDQPGVDWLGVPHDMARDSSAFRGGIVDLAEGSSIATPQDGYGLAYTDWFLRTLEAQDWGALDAFYAQHPPGSSQDPLEDFSKPATQTTRLPSQREVGSPSQREVGSPSQGEGDEYFEQALQERQLLWKAREQAEKVMDDFSRQFQKDLEQLGQTLQFEVDKARQEQEKKLEKLLREQDEKIANLENTASQRAQNIQQRIDRVEGKAGSEYQQAVDRLNLLENQFVERLDQLSQEQRDRLTKAAQRQKSEAAQLDQRFFERWAQIQQEQPKRGQPIAQEPVAARGRAASLAPEGEPGPSLARRGPETATPASHPPIQGNAAARTPWWREQRWPLAIGSLLAASLVVLIYMNFFAGPSVDPPTGSGSAPPPPSPPARGIDKDIEETGDQLRIAPYVAPLLTAAWGRADLKDWADAVVATRILGESGSWDPKESCTLLQATLSIPIDGNCGGGSKAAARNRSNEIREVLFQDPVLSAIPNTDASLQQDAPLVIRNHFRFSDACQVGWPIAFSGPCELSDSGARRLLEVAQAVRATQRADTGSTLAKIADLESSRTEEQQELPSNTGATLVRMALRLCSEAQDLGAEAASSLPTLEDLKRDPRALKQNLKSLESCLTQLQNPTSPDAEASGG